MTILEQAIKKAEANGADLGWLEPFDLLGNDWGTIIFDHSFAKAFWGEEINDHEIRCLQGIFEYYELPDWQYHLQTMVLEEDPIRYLEQFLPPLPEGEVKE